MTPSGTFKQPKKPDPIVLWWKGLPRETRAAVATTGGCLAGIAAIVWFAILPALGTCCNLRHRRSHHLFTQLIELSHLFVRKLLCHRIVEIWKSLCKDIFNKCSSKSR